MKGIAFLITAILGCLTVLGGCSGQKEEQAEPVAPVRVSGVRRGSISRTVTAAGILWALDQSAIVPKISAPVRRFYVNRGDPVRKGQLVAVLENRDLAAAAAENKGSYEQAQANYEIAMASNLPEQILKAKTAVKSAAASLNAARQLYNSEKKLYEQGALAKKQLNQAEVGLVRAQTRLQTTRQQLEKLQSVGQNAQLQAAQGQLAAAKGRYENAKAQLEYSEIRSPINGVVTDRPLYPGEMATAGTPLMTVMNISQIIVRAHVPESQAVLLKIGDPAEISVPGESGPIQGKVTVVSPALDPNDTTVQIWVRTSNPHNRLKPGMSVKLIITAKEVPDALIIPRSALLTEANQSTSVMVVGSDGRAHRTKVQTGIERGEEVQIIEGLKKGELVVSRGAYGLPDGTKVKYETPRPPKLPLAPAAADVP